MQLACSHEKVCLTLGGGYVSCESQGKDRFLGPVWHVLLTFIVIDILSRLPARPHQKYVLLTNLKPTVVNCCDVTIILSDNTPDMKYVERCIFYRLD